MTNNYSAIKEDSITDFKNILFLLKFTYLLKILKLFFIIFNTSYFIGILFLIIMDLQNRFADESYENSQDTFIEYFKMN